MREMAKPARALNTTSSASAPTVMASVLPKEAKKFIFCQALEKLLRVAVEKFRVSGFSTMSSRVLNAPISR